MVIYAQNENINSTVWRRLKEIIIFRAEGSMIENSNSILVWPSLNMKNCFYVFYKSKFKNNNEKFMTFLTSFIFFHPKKENVCKLYIIYSIELLLDLLSIKFNTIPAITPSPHMLVTIFVVFPECEDLVMSRNQNIS